MPEPTEFPFVERLAALLEAEPYHLSRVDPSRFEELWQEKGGERQRSLVAQPSLQIAGYLELTPTVLIADCLLGTLGLVYRLEGDVTQESQTILDQATYLRHLLLMEAGVDSRPPRRAYSVECVLVLSSRDAEQELKHVFRKTARETSFWHAIGVNVLVAPTPLALDQHSLRRAFSWLLASSRSWFENPPPPPIERRLSAITMHNYRLPGQRRWTLESGVQVHLLHGPNGSGKSSVAEALELSVTGKVRRLQSRNVTDYSAVIRNRGSSAEANITLDFDDAPTWSASVKESGVEESLNDQILVSSFRLDQDTMDDLARSGPAERAEVFLGSFFPKEKGATGAMERARAALEATVRTLPPEMQELVASSPPGEKADAIGVRAAWVEENRPPTIKETELIRPVSPEALEALRAFSPEIDVYATVTEFREKSEFERLLKGFNDALERLRARAASLLGAIGEARQCFAQETVRTWRRGTRGLGAKDWLGQLERWSEKLALVDLLERHLQLSEGLAAAARQGWEARNEIEEPVGLFLKQLHESELEVTKLRGLFDEANSERKALYEQLTHPTESNAAAASSALAPELTDRQVRALNAAGESLGPARDGKGFGTTLDRAFGNPDEVYEFCGVTIGGSDTWASEVDRRLATAQTALTHLNDESYVGPLARRENLRAAIAASSDVKHATERVKNIFLTKLQNERFNAALNELMALLTPARWAYDDLELTQEVTAGADTMELKVFGSTGTTADLLLNTAELNIFTFAIFLLAAIRADNPLGILLFDDPLQNMDELTVTTVARGLAKIARVFPPGWQLVFQFHGEDDLERFRQEISAAVYLMPWLAPAAATSDEVNITSEPLKSTFRAVLQDLDRVVLRRTPR